MDNKISTDIGVRGKFKRGAHHPPFRSQGHHTRHLRTNKHLHQQQLQEQQSQQQHQPPIEEDEDVIFIKETTTKELPTISLQPEDYTSIVNNERLFTNVINKTPTFF